jgi:1-deoxy-D-xylulose-5-phosphate synthase
MAFEAMAHAGHLGTDLMVILNDNKMSISKNVGAMSSYFNRLITAGLYNRARQDISSVMRQVFGSSLSKAAQRVEQGVKGILTPSTIFEELGWKYVGPVDGHDLDTLIDFFRNLSRFHGPVFFHCVTQKGRGYEYAEEDPLTYHGVRAFDIGTGKFVPASASSRSFTDVFADTMIEAADLDKRIVGITAAMPTGTGLSKFEQRFPDRTFDVGICEQHAVTFAAGLASQGMRPVCAIYSTFLQRGFDQLLHDVCIQRLPVVFAIDRAGAVGEDSPTQQGAFDLSFLRIVPEITVMAPRDDIDLRAMLLWALQQDYPVAIRYARGLAPTLGAAEGRDITRGEVLREGTDVVLIGIGPCLANALEAADKLADLGISAAVVDARLVKPLDTALLDSLAGKPMITLEENTVLGGFGSAVLEYYAARSQPNDIHLRMLGFPDAFLGHATRDQQVAEIGLDTDSIVQTARALAGQPATHPSGSV